MSHIKTMQDEMTMVANMDSRIPPDALRIAFCMGAMSTLPMSAKERAKAADWLGDQFQEAMMSSQAVGNS